MSKKVRIFLITALSLVLIGGLIFVVSMTALKWDFPLYLRKNIKRTPMK